MLLAFVKTLAVFLISESSSSSLSGQLFFLIGSLKTEYENEKLNVNNHLDPGKTKSLLSNGKPVN